MNDPLDLDARIVHIRADARRLAGCLEADVLTTPIPTCPGWDLRRLGVHTGYIHRWATQAIRTAAPPPADTVHEPDPDTSAHELGAWMRLGSGILVDFLATTRPTADTWHPFPGPQIADFWSRRMMIETALHRWDAENATGGRADLDPRLAASGIEEYFELGLPRTLQRNDATPPESRIVVRTDAGSWVVDGRDGTVRIEIGDGSETGDTDGVVEGSAESVLLVLMNRADPERVSVDDGASTWLDVPPW